MSPGLIEPPSRWGLLPEREAGERLSLRNVLRHWLIHFNPLYFASALSVLAGVFVVNRHFDRPGVTTSTGPHLVLFAVVQAYEVLIIGGAAFLVHRAGAVRPAVLLILLEALFLFDGTLRLESILLRGPGLVALSLAWPLLTLAKVWGMSAALRVRLKITHYGSIAAAAAALSAVVHLLAEPTTDKPLVLQVAAWLGALVLLALDVTEAPPTSPLAATDELRMRAARCSRAAFRIVTGVYFYHLWSYILVGGSDTSFFAAVVPQSGAFFLRAALVRPRARDVWAAGALVVVAALPVAAAVPYALLLVGAVFAWRVRRATGAGLAGGAAVAGYAGVWLLGWRGWGEPLPDLPGLVSWPTLALAVALAFAVWIVRDRLAVALLALGAGEAACRVAARLLPASEMGLGVVLLVAGFAFFAIGLAVNWWLRAPAVARASSDAAS
jgi:hypothetical protein